MSKTRRGEGRESPCGVGDEPEELDPEFARLFREVARAEPVQPEALTAAVARGDLVGKTVGHFKVLARLGEGGAGVVYCAEDTRLARRVALKVLGPRTFGPECAGVGAAASRASTPDVGMLQREARAAAAIAHPNVAAIYETGNADGVAFIAMEYVDGLTLRSLLASGPLPAADVLHYARQVAEGLAKAHACGVVHRDLKPDNVMIDRDGRVKILDFGLARPAPEVDAGSDSGAWPIALEAIVAGTPAYMSPEQARGSPVDVRSDVFAFGVLVYEMLSARLPFDRRMGDRSRWSFEVGDPLDRVRGDVPPALSAVVERCLRVAPRDRYAGGDELVRALCSVGGGRRRADARWMVTVGTAAGVAAAVTYAVTWRTTAPPHPRAMPTSSATMAGHVGVVQRRLTANISENQIVSAAISPDGTKLAFVDGSGLSLESVGGPAAHVDLAALGVVGRPRVVAWFPDGVRLAVCTAVAGGDVHELWVVSSDGAASSRRVAQGIFTGVAVSPDSSRVAFAAESAVGWLPLGETDASQHVLTRNEGCFISEVAWSPDGGRIAYASLCFDSLPRTGIETVSLRGDGRVVAVAAPHLYSSFVRAAGVVWTQAGEIIYPLAEWLPAEPGSSLWAVKVDSGTGLATAPPRAIASMVGVGAAGLSADRAASRIAYIRFEVQTDVYVGALSDGGRRLSTPRRLTLTDRNERPSAWSRDGRGVYFFSDQSGNFDIFYQDIGAGPPPIPVATDPEWETLSQLSPDGTSLLYWRFPVVVSNEGVHPEIVRRPVGGGAPVHVLAAEAVAHPAGTGRPAPWEMRMRCPHVEGAPCVLSEKIGDDTVFTAFDPERGRRAELYRERATVSASRWDVSPDGKWLAIGRADGPISLQPTGRSGKAREVPAPAGCDPLTPAWSVDGKGLFVNADCNSDDAPLRLYYVGLDGKATLLWKDPALYILEAVPSPDGEHLAIAVKSSHDDVWMLDGVAR